MFPAFFQPLRREPEVDLFPDSPVPGFRVRFHRPAGEEEEREDQRVVDMLASCNEGLSSLTAYDGDIPHLCFPQLIEDSMRAFDGDGRAQTYASTMLTTKEFKDILQSLYDKDYILIDIHSFAALETDGRGVTTMEPQQLLLEVGD